MNNSKSPDTVLPLPRAEAQPLLSAAADRLLHEKPKRVTVLCPVGITPYAAEGLTLHHPLFARVSYRPE